MVSVARVITAHSLKAREEGQNSTSRAPHKAVHVLIKAKTILFSCWTCLLLVSHAVGFGELGHQVIAALTQDMLTPKAKQKVDAILSAAEGGAAAPQLAKIAVWADKIRSLRPETRSWHFVNLELDEPGYAELKTDTPNVVTVLEKEMALLSNPNEDRYVREEALKWIVHLVGDLHQPLHTGEDHDKGGNLQKVKVNRRTYNLHQVWDFVLLERLNLGELEMHSLLGRQIATQRDFLTRNSQGTPRDWVNESHAKARTCYTQHGKKIRKGIAIGLDQDYMQASTLLVLEQVKIAAVRLAFVLNRALDPSGPKIVALKESLFSHSDSMTTVESPPIGQHQYAWSRNSENYHYGQCNAVAKIKSKNLRLSDFPPPGLRLHRGCPKTR